MDEELEEQERSRLESEGLTPGVITWDGQRAIMAVSLTAALVLSGCTVPPCRNNNPDQPACANAQHVARKVYEQVVKVTPLVALGILINLPVLASPCPNPPSDSSPVPHCDRRNEGE